MRGAQGCPGMDTARSRQLHPPSSGHSDSTSGKRHLRKGTMMHSSEEGGKKHENQSCDTQVREGGASGPKQGDHSAAGCAPKAHGDHSGACDIV